MCSVDNIHVLAPFDVVLSCLCGNEKICSIYKTDESRLRRFTGGSITSWRMCSPTSWNSEQQETGFNKTKSVSTELHRQVECKTLSAESDPNDTFLKDLELFDELGVTTIPTSDLEKTKSVVWRRGSHWTKRCVCAEWERIMTMTNVTRISFRWIKQLIRSPALPQNAKGGSAKWPIFWRTNGQIWL